jgi:hypothetical protein
MIRVLGIVSVIILALPFVILRGPMFYTRWFNGTDQILNFGTAILNLGLWTALLGNKKRDPQLLTVTAGLGVRVAAVAVFLGIRQLTVSGGAAREFANIIVQLASVVGTLIWCWAFRPSTRRAPAAAPHPPLTSAAD